MYSFDIFECQVVCLLNCKLTYTLCWHYFHVIKYISREVKYVVDESIDERPILKRSPEYKSSKDIVADKSPAKSVESKQPYNVVTTKVEATFREQPSSNPNNSVSKSTKNGPEKQYNGKKLMIRKAPSHGHSVIQCAAPAVPFMNGVNNGGNQYQLHMSQVCPVIINR